MTTKSKDLDEERERDKEQEGVKVVNKPATKGGEGEEENRDCRKGGPTKLPAKGGGQQQRPGKEEPLVERRQEGTSDHHQSWSQFLVGFIHPVWWHPPDDGRLRQAVADAEQPQVGTHPSQPAVWRPSFFLIFATTGW